MLDRAARLARLGTRLVSALAGLLMLALLAFGGFALWQDAAPVSYTHLRAHETD